MDTPDVWALVNVPNSHDHADLQLTRSPIISLTGPRRMTGSKRTWKHFVVMPYRSSSPEGRIKPFLSMAIIARAHNSCSDTVSLTLIYLFYRLARHPEQLRKLQTELDSLDTISDFTALQQAQHLNGIINETMRLHPATLTANIRQTPPEGAMISGKFVPGNIVICSPRYLIGKRQYPT